MKKNVAIVIMAVAIVFLGSFLIVQHVEIKDLRLKAKGNETLFTVTREQDQIDGFIINAISLWVDGKEKGAISCLEYALRKMKESGNYDSLGLLPDKMLRDPAIAKKLESIKKDSKVDARRYIGGFMHKP